MKKHDNRMGLHTPEEQDKALRIATGAFDQAQASLNDGDFRGYQYLYGYISGIQGLAAAENRERLVSDIQVLRERLVEMEKAIS